MQFLVNPAWSATSKDEIKPILELDDAVRNLLHRKNPKTLEELASNSKSNWVRQKASRNLANYYAYQQNWEAFAKHKSYAGHCAILLVRLKDSNTSLIRQAVKDALQEDPSTNVCAFALSSVAAAGFLLDAQIWKQIRVLVDKKQSRKARLLLKLLKEDKASTGQLNIAINKATKRISSKHPLKDRVSQELLAVSAVVAARRDAKLVGRRWVLFEQYIDADINNQVWPIVGKWASLDLQSHYALKYFARSALEDHSNLELAWRVRAALRVKDWKEVVKTIEVMEGEQAGLSAWQYWRAFAYAEIGNQSFAKMLMTEVANSFDDYYGLLAKKQVGSQIKLGKVRSTHSQIDKLTVDTDVRMAIALGISGRTTQARDIWKYLYSVLSNEEVVAISQIASSSGWILGSINAADTARRIGADHLLRFPIPYKDLIKKYSTQHDVNSAFIYALMRQESRFNPNAKSSAGASGLMQVMPQTAKIVARRHKYTRYSRSRLTLVETNIIIGTTYVADLAVNAKNDPVTISASYNAGPANARKWLRKSDGIDKMIFIETIPFTETRIYVKAILANYIHYDQILNGGKINIADIVDMKKVI